MLRSGASSAWAETYHLMPPLDWLVLQGKLESYIKLMQKAGYNSSSTLYVASGIFSYWGKASE